MEKNTGCSHYCQGVVNFLLPLCNMFPSSFHRVKTKMEPCFQASAAQKREWNFGWVGRAEPCGLPVRDRNIHRRARKQHQLSGEMCGDVFHHELVAQPDMWINRCEFSRRMGHTGKGLKHILVVTCTDAALHGAPMWRGKQKHWAGRARMCLRQTRGSYLLL